MNILSLTYLFLTAISGVATFHLLFKTFPNPFKLLAGGALGQIIITEFILIFSLILGFTPTSIILSLVTYIVFLLLIFILNPSSPPLLQRGVRVGLIKKAWRTLKSRWPLFVILATIGTFVVFIFWTKILAPVDSNLVTGGEGLYADTALHSAYTMSLVQQGLPPQNPLFAKHALVYPFLVNLFSASFIKLGSNLRFAFILPQIIYFFGFTTLFYIVAKKITKSNLATFWAMLIFFLGWGLGFTAYFNDIQQTHTITPIKEYTNNIPGFSFHNALTGLIFPERSFLPGLFIGLLITLLVLHNQKTNNSPFFIFNSKFLILTGIFLGLLPLWHTHTFIFFAVAVGIWILLPLLHKERVGVRSSISSLGTIYSIAFLLTLPVFLWSRQQLDHASFLHFSWGWMNSGKDIIFFWWKNTGLLLPLAVLGFYTIPKPTRYIFIPVFLIFILANFVVFQPWEWDNIKLFSWVGLFLAILAGSVLAKIAAKNFLGKILALGLFISLTLSGILSLIHISGPTFTIYDQQDIELATWVKTNTQPFEVFLIDPWPNHPIPGLTGRSVYVGYPGHLWVHGIRYQEREQEVKKILAGDLELLTKVPINYIATKPQDKELFAKLTLLFENAKFVVFRTNVVYK